MFKVFESAAPRPLWAWLALCLAVGGRSVAAQPDESIISFNDVAVRQPQGVVSQSEPDVLSEATLAGLERHSTQAFVPRAGVANPSFVENGFLVESFWAIRTGTPQGRFVQAHFHPLDLSTGFEAQHFGHRRELHGVYIRALDGRPFGLLRLTYRVTRNRQLPGKVDSIDGFSNFNISMLVARSFDPKRSVRGQFIAVPVGRAVSSDPTLPFSTVAVFGFEYVTEVYIASSASVDLDDIALARWEPAAAEPDEPRARSEPGPPGGRDAGSLDR